MARKDNTILVDINYYDKVAGEEKTLHVGTKGYATGPNDNPPNTYYEPLVVDSGSYRQDMFSKGATGGASTTSNGNISLDNKKGELDWLLANAVDGRAMVTREVTANGLATIGVGTMEQPTADMQRITIRTRDRQAELEMELQEHRYTGGNVAPYDTAATALEGVDDLKGQVKPVLMGHRKNITPRLVNTELVIYQYNDGPGVLNVPKDKGVPLTKGADYASIAEMLATAPAPGTVRDCPSAGYARHGSRPSGQVTYDATEGATAADRTAAQIIRRTVLRRLVAADLVEQGFIDLDKANSAEVGRYITSETTVAAVVNDLAISVGAWWIFDSKGKFTIRRLEAPTGNPVATITYGSQGMEVERLVTSDEGRGLPYWQTVLECDQNCTPQRDSDLGGDKTSPGDPVGGLAVRAWLEKEFRTVKASDATVKDAHKLAPTLKVRTYLSAADAQVEAERQQDLRGVLRDLLRVRVKRSELRFDDVGFWDDGAISDLATTIKEHKTAIHNNYLYAVGGYRNGAYSAKVNRLDLANPTGAWDDAGVTDLPVALKDFAMAVYNDYLYVFGGATTGGIPSAKTYRLNLANPTGAWDDAGVTDLPYATFGQVAAIHGSHVYILSGHSYSARVIRLDLANPTGAWDDAGVTDLPASWDTVLNKQAAVHGNYLYALDGAFTGQAPKVIRLDLTNPTGAWDDAGVTDLPIAGLKNYGVTVCGTYLYVFGGTTIGYSNKVIRLDLTNPAGAWDDDGVADLPDSRSELTAISINSSIFLIGGTYEVVQPNTYLYRSNDNPEDRSHIWDLGRVLKLIMPRFGCDAGKLFRLLGIEMVPERDEINLYLWG